MPTPEDPIRAIQRNLRQHQAKDFTEGVLLPLLQASIKPDEETLAKLLADFRATHPGLGSDFSIEPDLE